MSDAAICVGDPEMLSKIISSDPEIAVQNLLERWAR
jgi:hypothetical protein